MTSAISIRLVVPDDAADIVVLMKVIAAERMYSAIDAVWSIDDQRRYINALASREAIHLAVDDHQRIVGAQILDRWAATLNSTAHVGQLGTFILPEWRRRGVGAMLWQATLVFAKNANYRKLVIYVRGSNHGAQQFYRRLGFEPCGRLVRQVIIDGVEDDEIIMELLLIAGETRQRNAADSSVFASIRCSISAARYAMRRLRGRGVVIVGTVVLALLASEKAAFADRLMVPVEKDVSLEVMDWGGSGRPVVLLAGLGGTAPTLGGFALKLTPRYHVYGVTRRGFGESSRPASGYSADRLGDDVLAVIDFLKLDRPVLIGHSIAGEELNSIGSRHPEKVSGLVYLDAAYSYAYYDASRGDLTIDRNDLIQALTNFQPWKGGPIQGSIRELLDEKIPKFENDLRELLSLMQAIPQSSATQVTQYVPAAISAVMAGEQKYANIPVPSLAIFALPHDPGIDADAETRAWVEKEDELITEAQVRAFEKGVPSARVVRLPHASHNIFVSNEADVLREMDAFIGTLQ